MPWDLIGDATFATSFAGPEIARLQMWGTGDDRHSDYLRAAPARWWTYPAAGGAGARHQRRRRGALFRSTPSTSAHEQDDDGVTVTLKDRASGRATTRRARYLVGADGARSQIAEEIGLQIVGHSPGRAQIYARFNADLTRFAAHRPSSLYCIVHPAAGFGEIGMGAAARGVAVGSVDRRVGLRPVRRRAGPRPTVEPSRRSGCWSVAGPRGRDRVACPRGTSTRPGAPPTPGAGCSAAETLCIATHRRAGWGPTPRMQDAFNLAWKLAFVVKGYAGAELLDTYSVERAPVGAQIVARANQSRIDYAPLREAFAATDSDDPVRAGLAKIRSQDPGGRQGRGPRCYEALKLKNYEFNAQGVELNQRYDSAAVIPDPTAGPRSGRDAATLPAGHHPARRQDSARLAGRTGDGRRVSTLDVTGKGQITLLTGLAGQAWSRRRGSWTCRSCAPSSSASRARRPLRLLGRGAGNRRGRRASGPPRRLHRVAA